MSNHSISSQELLIGALLGALVGGTTASMMNSKSGKALKGDIACKYQAIRDNLDDFLSNFEKNASTGQAHEWTEKAKDAFENLREQAAAIDLSEHKELGAGLLIGILLGVLLGAGTTFLLQDKYYVKDEGILKNIGSQISSWKPLISELQDMINENTKSFASSTKRNLTNRSDDLLELAAAGLQIWNHFKKKAH